MLSVARDYAFSVDDDRVVLRGLSELYLYVTANFYSLQNHQKIIK